MSRTLSIDDTLYRYIVDHSAREHPAQVGLREATRRHPHAGMEVLNKLTLPIKATGLGDTRTLVIPVAPTIFWEAGAEVRRQMGIADGLVRLSVGLEDTADLIADFDQALG